MADVTFFRKHCSIVKDPANHGILLQIGDAKHVKKLEFTECLHALAATIRDTPARANDTELAQSGQIIVVDLRNATNLLHLFKMVGIMSKWTTENEPFTVTRVYYTLIIAPNKQVHDLFRMMLPLMRTKRPAIVRMDRPHKLRPMPRALKKKR